MTTYCPDEANSGLHDSGSNGKVLTTQAIPADTWQAYNRQNTGFHYSGGNLVMLKDICAFLKYQHVAIPPKTNLIQQIVTNLDMSASMWLQVITMMETFSLPIIRFLHDHQIQVVLVRELNDNNSYSLRHGTTVAHYDKGANIIRIPEYCRYLFGRTEKNLHLDVQILAHEIGHAIDYYLENQAGIYKPLRENPIVNIAYTMDLRRLKRNVPDKTQRRLLLYYVPGSNHVGEFSRARNEAIAEVIGACLLPNSTPLIFSAFPKLSIQIQRRLIQAKLLEVPPCQTPRT